MNPQERRNLLLKAVYTATEAHMGNWIKVGLLRETTPEIGKAYGTEADLQSDLLFLEERGLISTKKTLGGVIALEVTSYGLQEFETINSQRTQTPKDILGTLKHLFKNRMQLIGKDISADSGRKWIANVSAALGIIDASAKEQFDDLSQRVLLPLSDLTRVPIWNSMLLIIERVIASAEIVGPTSPERVYPAGNVYDFYRDLKERVQSSKVSILVVDPYIDEGLFDTYLRDVPKEVKIRLLTANPGGTILKAVELFKRQEKDRFECRTSTSIHDRVIIIDESTCLVLGQSIKDAASKKPTYVTQIYSQDMVNLYEDAWKKATPL